MDLGIVPGFNTGGSCSAYHDSLPGQYGYSGHVVNLPQALQWYYVTINFHLTDFYIINPSVTMACNQTNPSDPILVGKGIAAYPRPMDVIMK